MSGIGERSMSPTDVATRALVKNILGRTPQPQRGGLAVIADEESGEVRLTKRSELSAWLREHDLVDLADEAERRRVPPGALLVLFLRAAGPRFFIVGGDRPVPGRPRGRTRP